MSFENLALKCELDPADLQDLVYGHLREGIGKRLSVPPSSLQTFLDGGTSTELASKIRISADDLQFFRDQNGKDGAVGLLMGIMLNK